MLPMTMPDDREVAQARLPQSYENAKLALCECYRIDECLDWRNKAEAIASYARQARDQELERIASRIRARATRRCGELLSEFDARGRKNDESVISRTVAATEAGLTERQRVSAVRIAAIPRERFEDVVESEDPPRLSALAAMGAGKRERVQSCGAEDFAALLRRQNIAAVVEMLLRFDRVSQRTDLGDVLAFLLEERNRHHLTGVVSALAYAQRIKAGLGIQGEARRSPDLRVV